MLTESVILESNEKKLLNEPDKKENFYFLFLFEYKELGGGGWVGGKGRRKENLT